MLPKVPSPRSFGPASRRLPPIAATPSKAFPAGVAVPTPNRAVAQSAGGASRLPAAIIQSEFRRGGAMQHLMLRYTQSLLTQMAQTAVCNRHHSVDQQLCRWLLLSIDRLVDPEITMTQELIANILGVRREAAPAAPANLQKPPPIPS